MMNKNHIRFMGKILLLIFLIFSAHSCSVSPRTIREVKREISLGNEMSFNDYLGIGLAKLSAENYEAGLKKLLSKRKLFSEFNNEDFIWARENSDALKRSLLFKNSALEEILIANCKCYLARELHYFLDKILTDEIFQNYKDKTIFKLYNPEDYICGIYYIKEALGLLDKKKLSIEDRNKVKRLLLFFPVNISFKECIDILKNHFHFQNDIMQEMTLPEALFVLHIKTSQPWFSYFYRDYESDKNFYMNCIVSAIKNMSEKVLGISFGYNCGLSPTTNLSMRQQTIMTFITQFKIP